MTEVDKQAQYRLAEGLVQAQNFMAGTLAALVAAVAGAIVWGGIAMATGYMIGWVAIGVGILVGWGMQTFGKGLTAKFSAVAAVLAVLGCAGGNFAAMVMFAVSEYGVSATELLQSLSFTDLVGFYRETLTIMDLVFWLFAVGAAWQFAPRKLTEEEAMAVYAWEHRPVEEQSFISG